MFLVNHCHIPGNSLQYLSHHQVRNIFRKKREGRGNGYGNGLYHNQNVQKQEFQLKRSSVICLVTTVSLKTLVASSFSTFLNFDGICGKTTTTMHQFGCCKVAIYASYIIFYFSLIFFHVKKNITSNCELCSQDPPQGAETNVSR